MRTFSIQCAIAALSLGVIEGALRLTTARPLGTFMGWFPGVRGLYPENARILMPGPVPWMVETNRWGFRGPDLAVEKPPGFVRIAMLGDSVTDGFCVDNDATFPAMVEATLRRKGVRAEVVNAASGGASIDRELAVLRDAVSRFRPDIAVLTFVTNDVDALRNIGDEQLYGSSLERRSARDSLVRMGVVGTALGEWTFETYLRKVAPGYAAHPGSLAVPLRSADRYHIEGGSDFSTNSRLFLERFRTGDAMILGEVLPESMEVQLRRYLKAWDLFMDHAIARGMRPVFVYFPAYPQVYDRGSPTTIRDRLRAHSENRDIPFLDLTTALRAQDAEVLHLAPADYHLNPEGNRVIGEALAGFLLERGLVRTSVGAR
ncbi:MAG: SGNH/GDSL hydrolase family protein [Vicinamibacteria bacterium]|nr:SGNH/GDSL hydrolase family protein [Vicinamibacteria bacterium]MBP9946985.1 SGNH/GDSL hydrolase family protein [Vicinamibacteria bacterium]